VSDSLEVRWAWVLEKAAPGGRCKDEGQRCNFAGPANRNRDFPAAIQKGINLNANNKRMELKMKKVLCLVIMGLFLAAPSLAFCQSDQPLTGNAKFLLGGKFLDSTKWSVATGAPAVTREFETQYELGGLFDFRPVDWPINLAVDVLYSWRTEASVRAGVFELNLGVRKYFDDDPKLQPYIGGGGAYITADLDVSHTNLGGQIDDANGFGIWVNAGISYLLTERITIGGDIRYSWAEMAIFGLTDVNGGGLHAALTIGLRF